MKDVIPEAFSARALAYAVKQDLATNFHAIHSKNEGEVGRLILGADPGHVQQLEEHKEEGAFVGGDAEAAWLAAMYRKIIMKVAKFLGLGDLTIAEVEMLKSEPHSLGQNPHLDALRGVWSFFAPLVDSAGTTVKQQFYQDYPTNMGPKSSVPRHWSALADITINWEVGDLFVLRTNAIHGGPPSGDSRRYVLYGAEKSHKHGEYSDTSVVFEEDYFRLKQAFKEAQFAALKAAVSKR